MAVLKGYVKAKEAVSETAFNAVVERINDYISREDCYSKLDKRKSSAGYDESKGAFVAKFVFKKLFANDKDAIYTVLDYALDENGLGRQNRIEVGLVNSVELTITMY